MAINNPLVVTLSKCHNAKYVSNGTDKLFSPIRWSLRGEWFHVVAWKCAELASTFRCSNVPSVSALFHDLDDVSSVDL